ncbi:MAG: hypothetical protein ACRAVC_03545 [Trichormus sp.]
MGKINSNYPQVESRGAGKQGSRGAGEQGGRGTGEQGGRGAGGDKGDKGDKGGRGQITSVGFLPSSE